MGSRVVSPETTTLQISGGDWLLVKKRLNHGEQTDAFARKYTRSPDGGLALNLRIVDMAKVTAYLLDWSLTGLDDKQLVIRGQSPEVVESFLNAIDPASFTEISEAIDAHETAIGLAKKDRDGANGSPAISPSPSAVTGESSGSEPLTPMITTS